MNEHIVWIQILILKISVEFNKYKNTKIFNYFIIYHHKHNILIFVVSNTHNGWQLVWYNKAFKWNNFKSLKLLHFDGDEIIYCHIKETLHTSIKLQVTNWFGFLHVLVCCKVHRPRVHHGAGEQVGQLSTEGSWHSLVRWCERRGHKQGCSFGCWWDHVRWVNKEAWCWGRVGRHRVVDGPHTRGGSSCRGGLMELGFKLGLLYTAWKDVRNHKVKMLQC